MCGDGRSLVVGETLLVLQIFEKRLAGAGEANDRVGEARDFLVEVVGGGGGFVGWGGGGGGGGAAAMYVWVSGLIRFY